MPIESGYEYRDVENANGEYRWGYFQWGDSGARFYYTPGNSMSRERARTKAEKQRTAAYASGYDG